MTFAEERYSARYSRVRVFAGSAEARRYVHRTFGVANPAERVERDGTYLYRRDTAGFASGSPLAGYGVRQSTAGDDRGRVPRNPALRGPLGGDL